MERKEAWKFVTDHLKTDYLLKHLLATEACMRALARRLGEDEEMWGIAGLLHDIDLDIVQADPERHGKVGASMLAEAGVHKEIVDAVLAHADKKNPETKIEKGLMAVDPTTGFIVAAALIRPDKKLAGLETKSILKRMKEKRFAANVDRERMRSIESIGLDFEEFINICLAAMKEISSELGL